MTESLLGGAVPFVALLKSKTSDDTYEVDYICHGLTGDVYSGHRLSAQDGKLIGPRVWILSSEVEEVRR